MTYRTYYITWHRSTVTVCSSAGENEVAMVLRGKLKAFTTARVTLSQFKKNHQQTGENMILQKI